MYKEKRISQPVATDLLGNIGFNGNIPWQGEMPSDMERFVRLTTNHSSLMGRKTWDSIPKKFRPLRDRQNIILTNNLDFKVDEPEVLVVHSLEEAMGVALSEQVFIIGGAEIYKLFLPFTDDICMTVIRERFEGDTKFPWTFDQDIWELIAHTYSSKQNKNDKYESEFFHYIRKSSDYITLSL